MSTPRRPIADGLSLHIIHRGINKMNIFVDDYDRQVFLRFFSLLVDRFAILIHSYTILSTHDHLIVTPTGDDLPKAMKSLATKYTKYFNRRYGRCGTIWNERYKSKPIADEQYALTCLRYIEQNSVRANLVTSPDQYRWSTYNAYATGAFPEWITPHPAYLGLGSDPEARQAAYRRLFAKPLTDQELVEQRYI
jgi:putative transposase